MACLKTISIAFLILVLAGASPALAGVDGAYLTVTPTSGCSGTQVTLVAHWTVSGGADLSLLVSPDVELFVGDLVGHCFLDDTAKLLTCTMVIAESVPSGPYTLTFKAEGSPGTELAIAYLDVLSTCEAVGGSVQPVNTFAVLSPWLAVIGLVGCIGAVVVRKKRHP